LGLSLLYELLSYFEVVYFSEGTNITNSTFSTSSKTIVIKKLMFLTHSLMHCMCMWVRRWSVCLGHQ